jgi:hypothetical protein
MRRMGEWATRRCGDMAMRAGRAKISARRGRTIQTTCIRAGFEPRRVVATSLARWS